MTRARIVEIERELEIANLMVKDLQRLWESYARKALVAKQERELRQEKKGFLEYETERELIDAWGGAYIDEETYRRGLAYFENLKKSPTLSVVERHRKNIGALLNLWKGTVSELNGELYPEESELEENAFEKMDRQEREERYRNMM